MEELKTIWDKILGMVGQTRIYDNYAILVYYSPTEIPLITLSFQQKNGCWEIHNIHSALDRKLADFLVIELMTD